MGRLRRIPGDSEDFPDYLDLSGSVEIQEGDGLMPFNPDHGMATIWQELRQMLVTGVAAPVRS